MRISDWSSDVCSSDLGRLQHQLAACERPAAFLHLHMLVGQKLVADDSILDADARVHLADGGDLARRRRHAQQIVKDDAALDVVDLPERRRQADAIAFERTVAGDALRRPADLPAEIY